MMERSKSLSISSVKWYKYSLITFLSVLFALYMLVNVMQGRMSGILIAVAYTGMLIFYWYPSLTRFLRQIKEVAYDSENLYVNEGEYEVQIPFHEVKDIELVSLDGLYKFKLYHHDQFGKEVVCKPSIWYPFNFKKIDAELNRIRSMVRKAHRNYKEELNNGNSLASYN